MNRYTPVLAVPVLLAALLTGCATTPARTADEAAVLAAVQGLFDAMETRDTALAERVMYRGGTLVSVTERDGERLLRAVSHADWLDGFADGTADLREAFVGSPTVLVEGDVAIVWAEYTFELDGKPHHTGIDAITLVRTDDGWMIAGGAYSSVPAASDQ
jgi:hypothetical protein